MNYCLCLLHRTSTAPCCCSQVPKREPRGGEVSWGCCCRLREQGLAHTAVGTSVVAASRKSPPLLFCRAGFLPGQSLPDSLGDQSSPSRRSSSAARGSRAEPGLGSLRRRPHNRSATLLPAGLRLCPSWLLRKRRLDDVACLGSAGVYSE